MKLDKLQLTLKSGIHNFPRATFGSLAELIDCASLQQRKVLMIACSEQGAAPDQISFAKPDSLVVLQHLAASVPSRRDCEQNPEISCEDVQELFGKFDFRHIIVCGHLRCGVIRYWLKSRMEHDTDIGRFRQRFSKGTRWLVEQNYSPVNTEQRCNLMIAEHVLCQIDNLLTHPFVFERIQTGTIQFHGWVVDDESARVLNYCPLQSAFIPA
jgi:carbonic anhydrase